MGAVLIILLQPPVHVGLALLQAGVEFSAKDHAIALIEHGSMKPFAYPIGLRILDLRPGVVDVLNYQISLILMSVRTATIRGPAIRQHAVE